MKGADRRQVIGMAIGAALAPVLCTRTGFAQAMGGGLIFPPSAPMDYRRTLARDLVDGRKITMLRRFSVEFRPADVGYMLHGRQVGCNVEAPAALAQFARLEEQRDESGIFPLELDQFGQLRAGFDEAAQESEIAAALAEATRTVVAYADARGDEAGEAQLVSALHMASEGATAHMPLDLFAPREGARTNEQMLELPGGLQGFVETRFVAERDGATGLLRRASRHIATRIGNERRETAETWQLSAL